MNSDPMTWLQWAEALSYIVTVFGLPMAILVFMYEQRRQRQGDEEELYQRLSDEYTSSEWSRGRRSRCQSLHRDCGRAG